MTREEHIEAHKRLHAALDDLFADYIRHHHEITNFLERPISELAQWSYEQTLDPTEEPK